MSELISSRSAPVHPDDDRSDLTAGCDGNRRHRGVRLRAALEIGTKRRVVAGALDWPGLDRLGTSAHHVMDPAWELEDRDPGRSS